ncbi:hypothetical protein M9H77_32318 [Catharanthus roseus]|uniref:Uncharacterized protein n=1 Tax=Catharanthus roseus TaxID=4058 RepID=A0ACC0A3I5_CATRO|nr:hypothetical protein M9H77_32318 [Catharanthus roseus]
MKKAIPRIGSRRNGRRGSRKNARRIPKRVIHVQASFTNTIVTITEIRSRVVSWSSANTCGFMGTRRTPFAAQTAASNAIRTVMDQVSTRTLQWKCVESRTDNKRFYYGRFILSPLMKGQPDTIGIVMRRTLLREIEGTFITRVKFEKVPHAFTIEASSSSLTSKLFFYLL